MLFELAIAYVLTPINGTIYYRSPPEDFEFSNTFVKEKNLKYMIDK
ncbi:4458_t:CDS:2 [Ambispora leptoticha]|uniref:4458_t:CDS:1 n=1 Tax=Ambispora leptoticha TaxID=144679 RepID=A0A9N9BA82_9GLOM|nr:4458_t:CDS:2 [Ambispora leptoticha]